MKRLLTLVPIIAALAITASAQARVVSCANSYASGHMLVHNESVRNVSCQTVHSLMSRAWMWRSGTFAWGHTKWDGPARFAPPGWHLDWAVVYMSKPKWVMADMCGATERFTRGPQAFRITWGRVTPWTTV